MKLGSAAALALLMASGAAGADGLVENIGGVTTLPTVIAERTCSLDVELRGGLALVEQRQRFVNHDLRSTAPAPTAGRTAVAVAMQYDMPLPAGAKVTALEVDTGNGKQRAIAVTGHTDVDMSDKPQIAVDPALLQDTGGRYLLTLQPIAPRTGVDVTIRYVAPIEIRHGALTLSFPAREDENTPSCHGTIRATAGPGAKVTKFTVNGRDATLDASHRPQFDIDTKDVSVGAELAFTGVQPLVWTQSQPLSAGTATLVTIVAPPTRQETANRRTLFVIDGSRSMELVGKERVRKVVHAIASALPAQSPVDAIIYDRTATRVNGDWAALGPQRLESIENAIANHVPTNGSDLDGALTLAHTAFDAGARDAALVVMISDGVIGDADGEHLVAALGLPAGNVDVLSIVIDPAKTTSPGADAMNGPVRTLGGSAVEVTTDGLDLALSEIDGWLRPSFIEIELHGVPNDVPLTLLSGTGFQRTVIHTGPVAIDFEARASNQASPIKIKGRALAGAPVGPLALGDIVDSRAPYANSTTELAVIGDGGTLAKHRAALIAGGMPYERLIAEPDPTDSSPAVVAQARAQAVGPSAIAEVTLQMLFRNQLAPKAYACYQKALGPKPTLSGTVDFTFTMGRGEISAVNTTSLGDVAFDACILDAAYALSIPFPDFSVNADDQTIAHYPIRFSVADHKVVVAAGDADSSSPIDIDAIRGGVPESARGPRRMKNRVNLTDKELNTPLGTIRSSK